MTPTRTAMPAMKWAAWFTVAALPDKDTAKVGDDHGGSYAARLQVLWASLVSPTTFADDASEKEEWSQR